MDYQCLCDACSRYVNDERKEIVRKEVYHLVEYERVASHGTASECQNHNCQACSNALSRIYDYDNGYYY